MSKFSLALVVLFYISIAISSAQQKKEHAPLTVVKEIPAAVQNELLKTGQRKIQIYLIRHAKSKLKKQFFSSAKEAQKYITDYDKVPICDFDMNQVKIELIKQHQIYCSCLPRSQETALALFGKSYLIVSDSVFREFDMKIVHATAFVKLPMDLWKGISRLTWLLGFNNKGVESYKEARKRVLLSTDNLEKLSNQEETAILVGHGMINIGISKQLRKRGWTLVEKKGHINLGATVLQKIVPLK